MDARERSAERMSRAAAGAAEEGLGAVIVGPSPDLAYLSGYDPPPFERPTVLVLRPDRDPTLVVPELERALADVSAASGHGPVTSPTGGLTLATISRTTSSRAD